MPAQMKPRSSDPPLIASLSEGFRVLTGAPGDTQQMRPPVQQRDRQANDNPPSSPQPVHWYKSPEDADGRRTAGGGIWFGHDDEQNMAFHTPTSQRQSARAEAIATLLGPGRPPATRY
ncbi:hypothetical protein B0H10DRAFT_1947136 [Mycena sp. CBHHK59/15]|nr:hypothetical protein B0H10DRAFT_1947136 [Mycena sp. CBHHK59/15]